MEIVRLDVNGFRHLPSARFLFLPGINLITGANGIGKTSLLEAVACLSDGASFRTKKDQEMINHNQEVAYLDGRVITANLSHRVKFQITKQGKFAQIDAHLLKRMSRLIGMFIAVVFVPQDIYFFQEAPRIRRRFIDLEISKVEPRFITYLLDYRKLLKEKSVHLKSERPNRDLLVVYNRQLAQLSAKIVMIRKRFLRALEDDLNFFFHQISQKEGRLEFAYLTQCDSYEEDLLILFNQVMDKEIAKKVVLQGVHLDDFTLNHVQDETLSVGTYFSQGEQRISVLALKLALMRVITRARNEDAVLLLDDVLSELDYQKQNNLLEILKMFNQVIITTNEIAHLPAEIKAANIIDLNRKEKEDGTKTV